MTINDATAAQIAAANPSCSTWVSANAGSGKTRVLTDRVARLLLHGTDPQKILCLTYTNAAAAEMQNRLFKRLGKWSMLENNLLIDTLVELGEPRESLSESKLRRARTLFASALETPGGLKIQTIHSFCDALLRQFPLEAQVSPQFEILEERYAKELRSDILEQLADSNESAAFENLAQLYTGFNPDSLLHSIAVNHHMFTNRPTPKNFGLSENINKGLIVQSAVTQKDIETLQTLIPICQSSGVNDKKFGNAVKVALQQNDPAIRLQNLFDCMLDKKRFEAKTKTTPAKAIKTAHPELINALHDCMERVEQARETLVSLRTYHRACVLFDFAHPYLQAYSERKTLHGKLDYQDLIEKSADLLENHSMSQWILYRLDGGIDHILVDEAQDTSPDQWRLIQALSEEFTSGLGARDTERTIFVVGDEKQSIYSFQGADPKYFGHMQEWFNKRLHDIDNELHKQDLLYSFRSAKPILDLVDHIFVGDAKKGIIGNVLHNAFDGKKPGRVELWPLIEPEPEPDDMPWFQPLDRPNTSDPKQLLAKKIAQWIKDTINSGAQLLDENNNPRPITSGDFLILVQSRAPLFRAIIKELKNQKLNVAGADRLEVGQELAVKDILSLLKFAVTPEDDLSLAEALRSPLLNISEAQLFTLAHNRKGTLWQSFRKHKDAFPDVKQILDDVLNKADWMRPYELIERILSKHKGRENLLDRLGEEAEDGIDELLSQSMYYEQSQLPTLTGFLNWFSSGKVEIKREMDSSAGQIRVMTVHAAKGLEAPIVILPDTVNASLRDRSEMLPIPQDGFVWKTNEKERNKAEKTSVETKREMDLQEKLRLLYVALTRAENWLIVCGAGKIGKEPALNWYHLVENGIDKSNPQTIDGAQVLQNRFWLEKEHVEKTVDHSRTSSLPHWLTCKAPNDKPIEKPLSPSNLGGAKTLEGEISELDQASAMRRGSMIHLLLEHLPSQPQNQWENLADIILQDFDPSVTNCEIADTLKIAANIVTDTSLTFLFSPQTLSEVEITANLPELAGQKIHGAIDRLVVTENKILAVDYKSNRIIPKTENDVPLGLLRQMGAYLSALKQIYPNHKTEVAILWTENGQLMPLTHDIVIDALISYTTS